MKTREEIQDRVDELLGYAEGVEPLDAQEQAELDALDWVLGG